MTEMLPVAEVRNHLSQVLARVERHHDRIGVTRNGRQIAVVLSPDDLASLEETVAVLADRDLMEQIGEDPTHPAVALDHAEARARWVEKP